VEQWQGAAVHLRPSGTKHAIHLFTSLENGVLKFASHIIAVRDNEEILKCKAEENPSAYCDADSAKGLF